MDSGPRHRNGRATLDHCRRRGADHLLDEGGASRGESAASQTGQRLSAKDTSSLTPCSALYASKIISYAGLRATGAASKLYNWGLNFGDIATIWRGGCIIRAFLTGSNKPTSGTPISKICFSIRSFATSSPRPKAIGAMRSAPLSSTVLPHRRSARRLRISTAIDRNASPPIFSGATRFSARTRLTCRQTSQ